MSDWIGERNTFVFIEFFFDFFVQGIKVYIIFVPLVQIDENRNTAFLKPLECFPCSDLDAFACIDDKNGTFD